MAGKQASEKPTLTELLQWLDVLGGWQQHLTREAIKELASQGRPSRSGPGAAAGRANRRRRKA
ncbi:hypothetical protein LCGC14_0418640 [marine sediment metagenome]|uniref:Uncharacterized protein n=1 Tax=marine sediment metagenome TaxID=412755 RepID=A0A0F9VDI1_9ZZZZ|nr:hypothetical protein [Phycisphaerae bacterium]HDZ42568.1 hypothetical protein [Phycisphaerae bacterium]